MGLLNLVFFASLAICCTYGQNTLQNTVLIGYMEYMENVLQTFVNDLEEAGFSTVRMKDFTQSIKESMYGLEVDGDLHYSDGFLVSVQSMHTKKNSINFHILNPNMTAVVRSVLVFEDVEFVYDVTGVLTDRTEKATGIYRIPNIEWAITVEQDLETELVSVDVLKTASLTESRERIRFLPKNNYTAVFSRNFSASMKGVVDSLNSWKDAFIPILEEIVTNKIEFPKISFDRYFDNVQDHIADN